MTASSKARFAYRYPRPALTVDIVLFAVAADQLCVLLIERKGPPFAGTWALPGGFVDENETVEAAAHRELLEETGLDGTRLNLVNVFSEPGRDPRGWTVSAAFSGLVDGGRAVTQAGDDAAAVSWFPLDRLPPLAFDHNEILTQALRQWRAAAIPLLAHARILGNTFTWSELRKPLEVLLGVKINRTKLLNHLLRCGAIVRESRNRPTRKTSGRQSRYRFSTATLAGFPSPLAHLVQI